MLLVQIQNRRYGSDFVRTVVRASVLETIEAQFLGWAVSSLKCNTGLQAHDFASEDLGRGFESEAFSRAVV